ncbi:FeoA family protein [Rhizorhabdus argentea]|uniref:FeoA family protein n=1 Tax=Rhizorhabdus argentea TaxID=1387174 RepID=UPI0030ED006C
MELDTTLMTLDKLPLGSGGEIVSVDWAILSDKDGRRLRELGVDEGVPVEKLHKGPFGIDPIACRIGRMTVALRSAQAAAIGVGPRRSQ